MKKYFVSLMLCASALFATTGHAAITPPAGALPTGMPSRLVVGLFEQWGGTWMRDSAVPWDVRYAYFTKGWSNNWGWGAHDGSMATARERTPVVLMDHVVGESGAPIIQASIDAIKYRVFEYASDADARADANGEEIGTEATLDVADVVFDELQTDPPWDAELDERGYNFRFTLPGSRRPAGDRWYRVEIWLTPSTSDEAFPIVWLIKSLPLASA